MAACTQAAKKALRSQLKKQIRSLTLEQKKRESLEVTQKLLSHKWYQQSCRIAVYLSMDDEVDMEPIVKHILASGRDCFVPRYVGDRMDMLKLYSLDDLSSLPLTKWNIKQPADDDDSRLDAFTAGGLDLIVVPGLGFTIEGDRLGRGKGYYDSYLSLCESRALMPKSIGLAFSAQMCKSIPMGPTDKKIDLVLYPQGTEPGTIENI